MISLTIHPETNSKGDSQSQTTNFDGPRPLLDGHGRVIDHLRLSVTSACNLRCLYCRPGATAICKPIDLTDAQRLDLIRFMVDVYGLRQLRLTGGEPLLYPSIVKLIESIRSSMPKLMIAMTTNGWRLGPMANDLRNAGLDRLNVSLDCIDPNIYRQLTGGELTPVLHGLERAIDAGFPPPRLNAVVLAGYNDDRLSDMVAWAISRHMEIRFLEAMPIGPAIDFNRNHFVPAERILESLRADYSLDPISRHPGETARRFGIRRGEIRGTIGVIAPLSETFCGQCRRVRITADGRLFPCLLDNRSVVLRRAWRDERLDTDVLDSLIQTAVSKKRANGHVQQVSDMVSLGG